MAKHNVTTKELVKLLNDFEPLWKITPYIIEKNRFTQAHKNALADEILRIQKSFEGKSELFAEVKRQAFKAAKENPPLWPSLRWDL
ncbi:MAG: hypothetical protein WBC05_16140 [Sedimentisphaerales bacterium]